MCVTYMRSVLLSPVGGVLRARQGIAGNRINYRYSSYVYLVWLQTPSPGKQTGGQGYILPCIPTLPNLPRCATWVGSRLGAQRYMGVGSTYRGLCNQTHLSHPTAHGRTKQSLFALLYSTLLYSTLLYSTLHCTALHCP